MQSVIIDRIDSSSHLISMTSGDLIIEMGYVLCFDNTTHILDLCCGYGEMLRLLSHHFGIFGTGIDVSEEYVSEGRKRITDSGLSHKVSIECHDARDWPASGYNVACLVGEQGVFGGFKNTMKALFDRVHAHGRVVIGTPYFNHENVPQELIDFEGPLETEKTIFELVRANDCIITFIGRGTREDWDRYISWSTRRHLLAYRGEMDPEEKQRRFEWMHRWHDVYHNLRMEHEGWAIYAIEKV
jgi:SAM-dependent methyltransferase